MSKPKHQPVTFLPLTRNAWTVDAGFICRCGMQVLGPPPDLGLSWHRRNTHRFRRSAQQEQT